MELLRVGTVDLEFACLCDGPEDGPLALCLHGFPDTAHTWRHLLPALAEQRYRAVAPFMRGYAPSDLPSDGRYQVGALARDANRIHAALEADDRAVLIGHDWGALAGYGAVTHEPTRWRRLVTAAVPPPQALASSFFSYDQLRRSWYTFLFQTPLAEMAVPLHDFELITRLWADWSPGYDAGWDVERVKESIGTPERTLAAISYYRALYDAGVHDPELAPEQEALTAGVPITTLYLHGAADGCMALDVIDDPLPFLGPGSRIDVIAHSGHFVHLEQPEVVRQLVLEFLKDPAPC
jgi:pimeloyl-ACP methyl ester carboxylesterase